jgi:hypothetical protein
MPWPRSWRVLHRRARESTHALVLRQAQDERDGAALIQALIGITGAGSVREESSIAAGSPAASVRC